MQNRHLMTGLKTLVLLGASLFAISVHAIQMGNVASHSAIGEPLDATLGLWLSPSDKAQQIRFKVSPDLAYLKNARLTEIVSRMEARLEQSPSGVPYVRISTDAPVAEPIVAFRLKVYVGDVAVMRNFALALSPARVAMHSPAAAAQRTGSSAVRYQPPTAVEHSAIDGPTYTAVQGDTLWGIARRVSETDGGNIAALANQIFAANPRAFVNGDENKLMVGARLQLPRSAVTNASVDTPAGPIEIVVPGKESSVVAMPIEAAMDTVVETVAPKVAHPLSTLDKTREKIRWQQRNPELAAELAALKTKYAALKARYDLQPSPITTTETEAWVSTQMAAGDIPATSNLQAPADSPSVTQSAQPARQKQLTEPPALSAPSASSADLNVTDEDVVMAAESQALGSIFISSQFQFIAGSIIAILAIILIYIGIRRVIIAMRASRAERRHWALEEDRRAEVARKAKNRIEMENEVQRMLDLRDDDRKSRENLELQVASAPVAENLDAEIDRSIAHGRYAEAENLLTEVIAATPRNYSAKLRLIEVYYMTERVEEFCQIADDLHRNHRADMADEEWRRVVRMGKIVAPNRPPFSGPRAVSTPTQA